VFNFEFGASRYVASLFLRQNHDKMYRKDVLLFSAEVKINFIKRKKRPQRDLLRPS